MKSTKATQQPEPTNKLLTNRHPRHAVAAIDLSIQAPISITAVALRRRAENRERHQFEADARWTAGRSTR